MCLILLLQLSFLTCFAQTNPHALYLKFTPPNDTVLFSERSVTIKTKRLVHLCTFCSPCNNCRVGKTICFYYHDSIENGEEFEPVKTVTDTDLKKIKFITPSELYSILYNNNYRVKYKIYILRTINGKHLLYNVKLGNPLYEE